jgi:hypothetical protein
MDRASDYGCLLLGQKHTATGSVRHQSCSQHPVGRATGRTMFRLASSSGFGCQWMVVRRGPRLQGWPPSGQMCQSSAMPHASRSHTCPINSDSRIGTGVVSREWCFSHYREVVESLPVELTSAHASNRDLLLFDDGDVCIFYAPFDLTNTSASSRGRGKESSVT